MNIHPRIHSILKAKTISAEFTGVPTFELSELDIPSLPEIELPDNLRLGHLVERVVSQLIGASRNYNLLHENIQIVEGKETIGELDFILQDIASKEILHLELAYKFYLYDSSLSDEAAKCWIGPNRNDSLIEKLRKLKDKQFPLLFHPQTRRLIPNVQLEKARQALCLMAMLYVPFDAKTGFGESPKLPSGLANYQHAIAGSYLDFETFKKLDHTNRSYALPSKRSWGMDPSTHREWVPFDAIQQNMQRSLNDQRAVMCWSKKDKVYVSLFVVWW